MDGTQPRAPIPARPWGYGPCQAPQICAAATAVEHQAPAEPDRVRAVCSPRATVVPDTRGSPGQRGCFAVEFSVA